MADGFTSEQIGKKVYLGKRTVDGIVVKMLEQFDVTNKTALVAYCLRKKLID